MPFVDRAREVEVIERVFGLPMSFRRVDRLIFGTCSKE
jgi:hypothetical protein